jgi:hypothetical protein
MLVRCDDDVRESRLEKNMYLRANWWLVLGSEHHH